MGNRTPPTGESEVLQADEYIKGLLLWTVQSFSCCFNAACPIVLLSVPSVEQVSLLDIKALDGPEATLKGIILQSHKRWNENWTSNLHYVFKYM